MGKAGVPRRGPTRGDRSRHSFRHTFAKKTLEAGASISWLKRQLGHSTAAFTDDRYGHWERKARKDHLTGIRHCFGNVSADGAAVVRIEYQGQIQLTASGIQLLGESEDIQEFLRATDGAIDETWVGRGGILVEIEERPRRELLRAV